MTRDEARAAGRWLADAFGTMAGALTGTSTVTSYIESASGVAAGARTGLGNIVIAVLFLLAMFCAPLVAAIPAYATAPALVLVGVLMCGAVARVRWGLPDACGHAVDVQHCHGS